MSDLEPADASQLQGPHVFSWAVGRVKAMLGKAPIKGDTGGAQEVCQLINAITDFT